MLNEINPTVTEATDTEFSSAIAKIITPIDRPFESANNNALLEISCLIKVKTKPERSLKTKVLWNMYADKGVLIVHLTLAPVTSS